QRQSDFAGSVSVLLLVSAAGLVVATGWHWLARRQSRPTIPHRLGYLLQLLLVLASLCSLVVAWQLDRLSAVEQRQAVTVRPLSGLAKHSNYEFHMQLEAQLPAHLAGHQSPPAPPVKLPCIDFQRGLLIGGDCPL
ncbi:MAG TPA: hypothetical protein PKE45_05465, partial [Caldilineaceae bacterium]|nr:hypothetical protein [Caldilineaceae bacterium]